MNKDFTLDFRGTYIHVQHVPGFIISPEGMNRLYLALAKACKHFKCNRVFAEGAAVSRQMNMAGAFDSGAQITEYIAGISLACFLEGYKTDELTEFFKTVASNRGARVEFFSDREEAFHWLGVRPAGKLPAGRSDDGGVTHFLL
jgi:hypothetical protein